MLFSSGRMKKLSFTLEYEGIVVRHVDNFKYLGVRIDSKLTFNLQYDFVLRNMLARIQKISQYKAYFNVRKLRIFSDSLIVSLLNFCLPIWGFQKETKTDQLNKALVKMSNMVAGKSNAVLERKLDVIGRRSFFTADFLFKHVILKSQLSSKIQCIFTVKQTDRCLRDTNSLIIPRLRTAFGQASPSYQMIKVWNSLPHGMRGGFRVDEFRECVKKYLIDCGYCFKF